jgi:ATP phosphoribosyltransferase
MTESLIIAIPSKGRLMEQSVELFAAAGLTLRKVGNERGYRGEIAQIPNIEITYISASEIAWNLKTGRAHMGITGLDLVREQMSDAESRVSVLKPLGFGHADVVTAIPDFWIDVRNMADLEEISGSFHHEHGRWLRVATKYVNTTRRFFALKGMTDYRLIESLGATEGAPAAGTADLIVDITTTGATLAANGLRVLDDGLILKSEATLFASHVAPWSPSAREAQNIVMDALGI